MYVPDAIINRLFEDPDVGKAIGTRLGLCLSGDEALDLVTEQLLNKLESYFYDNGSNVRRDVEEDIKDVLRPYLGDGT